MHSDFRMFNRSLLFVVALLVYQEGLAVNSALAQADDFRVALVIGNSNYPGAPLHNAANDARDVGRTLQDMGYTIVEVYDGSKGEMEKAIQEIGHRLEGRKGVGLVYYAGHAFQLGWKNYMVPVNSAPVSAAQAIHQAVDLQLVLDTFSVSGSRVNIIVLDACRDNPFSIAADTKGLAPVNAPPDTLIAYSTAPGNLAEDGDVTELNGPYARFLIAELRREGVRLEDAFKRVRLQVRRLTNGRQVPWESTSLETDFYVNPKTQVRLVGKNLTQIESSFNKELDSWRRVRGAESAESLTDFLMEYPSGSISEIAQFRLDQMQVTSIRTEPGRDGLTHLRSGVPRYSVGDMHVLIRQGMGGAKRRVENHVTRIDGERVEFNDGSYVVDQMGALIKNRYGTKEPGVVWVPADLFVGKKWRTAFTNTRPDGVKTFNYWDSRVVGIEDVTVPAGTFKTYRVERTGQARNPSGSVVDMTATSWIDPATMQAVRRIGTNWVGSRITERYVDELVELHQSEQSARSE